MKIIKTVCDICGHAGCSIRVHVDADGIRRVEGDPEDPRTGGMVCPQGIAAGDIVHSNDRLTHPLIRIGNKNEWRKATWDEALTIISSKIKETKETYGSESVVFARGYARPYFRRLRPYLNKLADLIGTSNLASMGHVCAMPRRMGTTYVFGGIDPWDSADYENSKCIVLWGINPSHNPPKAKKLDKALMAGRTLIVIDPRATPFAKRADIHLQPRPGTDGALALSMMNVIIEKGLTDETFLENWSIGFDGLKDLVQAYPSSRGSEITWIDEKKIIETATTYATENPSSIDLGNGLDQHTNNFATIRAIASLIAITGNLDVAGGNLLPPRVATSIPQNSKQFPEPVGRDRFPLRRGAHLPSVWKAILEGKPYKVRSVLIFGANPAVTDCDTQVVCKALSELEFLVVVDLFMTATARFADIILPAASFLETEFYLEGKKVIDPPGEAWPDQKIIIELGKKMGFKKEFQTSFKTDFQNMPSIEYRKHFQYGFQTPSGKVELSSKRLEELGYSALPDFVEPRESPLDSEHANTYPLVLTTGAKLSMYTHSQFRNIPRLRKLMPKNYFMINPNTASKYGIEDREKVIVESPTGRLVGVVKTTCDLLENVIQLFHGFEDMNTNLLTSSKYFDSATGSPGLKSTLCKIVVDEC